MLRAFVDVTNGCLVDLPRFAENAKIWFARPDFLEASLVTQSGAITRERVLLALPKRQRMRGRKCG
jgi:hypothetical protein